MNRIKCLRKSKKLSQAEFGAMFHVDQTAVSNWEKDKNNIDVKILEQIAESFNVPIEFVLGKEFEIQLPMKKWSEEQIQDYNKAEDFKDLILFRHGRGKFHTHFDSDKKSPSITDELEAGDIIYHRNGKNVRRHFTEEQLKILLAMIDAMPENEED